MIAVKVVDRQGQCATFSAESGQRLLQAGLAAGVGLPHECATGTCGSCKATVVKGDVRRLWPEAPGAKALRSANETLLCQSAADGPVELSLRANFIPPYEPAPRETKGELSLVRELTPEVALFSIALHDPMAWQPGQFVLVSGLGIEGARGYSMTREVADPNRIDLLIRKDPAGRFSTALFDDLERSHEVTVFGPLGRATFSCDEGRPFIAMAGGSGIAGILAILDHAMNGGHFSKHQSKLFFGLRDAATSYLLDEISAAVAASQSNLAVTVAFSNEACSPEFAASYPNINFANGFVHDVVRAAMQSGAVPADTNPIFFVAGPPVMVNATMRMLVTECKVSPAEIRYDRFG